MEKEKQFTPGQSARHRASNLVALLAIGAAATITAPLYATGVGGFFRPLERAEAILLDGTGNFVGTVELRERRGNIAVIASFDSLPPGFHGFHVHSVGTCTAPAFTSAGGHLNPSGASHPNHAGDMPALLVNPDGTAELRLETDRFTLDDLLDADGSAIIVHAGPDNYANIPTDRYDPDPDATTLGTGDSGGRLACGVIRKIRD